MPNRHSIPAVIEPIDDISICVPIPNHPDYVAAFIYAVRQLTNERHWERRADLASRTVRRVWMDRTVAPIIEQLANGNFCDMLQNCDDIADCIDNTTSVQTSITTVVQNSGTANPDTINPDIPLVNVRFPANERDMDITEYPSGCDRDALWAGIRETVVRLDDGARQFLEQAVAQADKAERAATIISAIPLVGDLAAAVITTFSEIAPDLLNLFNAYSSAQNIDEISCALFEVVCSQCRYPTYDEYWNYFSSGGISGLDDIGSLTFTAITDLLFGTQNLAALVAYHTIISYELYVMYLGSTFTSFRGTKWLGIWASFGEDLPNDNWMILCNCITVDWLWSYATSQCDYQLPINWLLNIISGQCGDGPGTFDGLYDFQSPEARLTFTITPTVPVTNIRLVAASNVSGGTNRTIRVTQGLYDSTVELAPNWNTYNFATNESGVITVYLTMDAPTFAGVGVREIEMTGA